ncbi:MAG: UDP-N-acetylmuramoyl-tripeptide--D-alanyl-D-alanine ligase [Clostridia bacterium]|nr:UDP-N-acetylmuramoyl-tripeptide--D-alanyl-D-alanine ligase [Clostridia bacterium]
MNAQLKLRTFTPREIADAVGGELYKIGKADGNEKVTSVSTSSSEVTPGAMFCAIKGERVDGADFIPDALSLGAVCVLTTRVPDTDAAGDWCAVVVADVVKALGTLSGFYRDFSTAKFVAITGSVGKTTTKGFVYAVASSVYKTHKTKGNHNNELGLPMTLFELEPDDKVSVIELGMSNLGEIEYMSHLVKPDIAVITNIGTSHLASLGTRENICLAKLEITAGLNRETGIILLNADEPLLLEKVDELPFDVRLMSIKNRVGDYRAMNIRQGDDGITFDMICDNKAITNVEIPIIGRHNVYNALTAYAVGTMLGLQEEDIRRGLLSFEGEAMRQRIYDVGSLTVIDDCYNASPESMRAAIDVLVGTAAKRNKRPIALIGDMLELGDYSRLLHDQIGQYAAQANVAKLFCYGLMSDVVAEAAIKKGIRAENVFVCLDTRDPQTIADMICDAALPGDVLLVKASRGVHAERVIECLKKKITKMKQPSNNG